MNLAKVIGDIRTALYPQLKDAKYIVHKPGIGAPIVIQPGFTMTGNAHTALIKHFMKSTNRPVWSVPAPDRTTEGIGELAKRFGQTIQAANKVSGERATVIAHSYGGLISREYLQAHEGYKLVDQLITIGAPHSGLEYFHPSLKPIIESIPVPGIISMSKDQGSAKMLNKALPSFMSKARKEDPNFQIVSVLTRAFKKSDMLVSEREAVLPKVRGVHTAVLRSGILGNHASNAGIGPILDPHVSRLLDDLIRPSTGIEPQLAAKAGAVVLQSTRAAA